MLRQVSKSVPIVIGLSLLLLSCSPSPDVLRMVERGDHSAVHAGKYPHHSSVLDVPSEYDADIALQRERIEGVSGVMNRLTQEAYPTEGDGAGSVTFNYRGASVNEGSDELILWYMGLLRDPRENAGYRAQWVFDRNRQYLTSIYLSVVPLE